MDIVSAIESLKEKREIFHSEADFQFALAWEIQAKYPNAEIRLEYPIIINEKKEYIDILVVLNGFSYPIELKYKTTKLKTIVSNEKYDLKDHSARDGGFYDCIKDIVRVEAFAEHIKDFSKGYVLWLTNDSGYWKNNNKPSGHEEFKIFEGKTLTGIMKWGSQLSANTIKGREKQLVLKKKYTVHWYVYSEQNVKSGLLKYALLSIQASIC